MLETTAWPPPLDDALLAARAEPAWKARADAATAAIVQNRVNRRDTGPILRSRACSRNKDPQTACLVDQVSAPRPEMSPSSGRALSGA